jgi:hypothetical protein
VTGHQDNPVRAAQLFERLPRRTGHVF